MTFMRRIGIPVTIILIVSLGMLGCADMNTTQRKTAQGAAVGTAAGAALGALIGSTQGEMGKGALIGSVAGAAVGTAVGHKMGKQAQELEQIPNTQVEVQEDKVVVTMDNSILFAVNSSTVQPAAQGTLRDIAQVMVKYPDTQIMVKGHTDSTGGEEYNQQLSERRANVVKNILISYGVPAHRITAIGLGEVMPIASNDTPDGRAMNRRVEIEVRPIQ
ncbi:OmpA/MotB domain protein [Desulfatibacillum aliphaticivorans]|uniref:OmpA/MotB domain protein n=1 Tax=Desulfatibacillum aliphaticivorans TaxID=218208 RepID=B8FEH3_DESAL|nr:OmpA family protein [Desulfatibacillum aliphaticivorans]ACL06954.1 OmpA/MotB domain protein [Desulfatibacillum aliphaticivorans]